MAEEGEETPKPKTEEEEEEEEEKGEPEAKKPKLDDDNDNDNVDDKEPDAEKPDDPEPQAEKPSTDNDNAETNDSGTNGDYIPKNILLTGGAGFIASHVAILLCQKYPNYRVVVYDRLDYCSCLENLAEIQDLPNYKFIKGDIATADLVSYVLREEKIDTILHFAAQTHVDNSFGNSFAFTHSNIYGTHVLLESAKVCKTIQRFVHVSTDEVYGEGENFDTDPMSEEHVLEPTNPYAATKAGAEFLVKSYFRSFQLPCLISRGNNVYGPHQFPEKLIPKFTNQLMKGMKLTIHGDGTNTRNFLYVTDVANAFDVILHKGTPGHVYNIGGKNEIANIQVAKDLIQLFGLSDKQDEYLEFVPDRKFNDLRYTINSKKLHDLGWQEQMTWEEGLKLTVDWYKKYTNRYGNIDDALVAHPRMLNSGRVVDEEIMMGEVNITHMGGS